MNFKKIGVLLCLLTYLIVACNHGETEAMEQLSLAEQALDEKRYSEAKMHIDSIRLLYPNAFETRKKSISLMQRIDLSEQEQTINYLDSMLAVLDFKIGEQKKNFVFEKDTLYQEVGNYFHPSQVVEQTINRSFLRAQVNEHGQMILTSIYCGERSVHHHAVKVVAEDGTFAETLFSSDVYESGNLGWKIEKADYPIDKDGGVTEFVIAMSVNQQLKLHFLGERSYISRMRPEDCKAISSLYGFSKLLLAKEDMLKDKEEAKRKIEFIKRKMLEKQAYKE